jgi:hypothetical protein
MRRLRLTKRRHSSGRYSAIKGAVYRLVSAHRRWAVGRRKPMGGLRKSSRKEQPAMRRHFTKQEVEELVAFVQESENEPAVPGYGAHPTIKVQKALADAIENTTDERTERLGLAYLRLFKGGSATDVAEDVYNIMAEDEQ